MSSSDIQGWTALITHGNQSRSAPATALLCDFDQLRKTFMNRALTEATKIVPDLSTSRSRPEDETRALQRSHYSERILWYSEVDKKMRGSKRVPHGHPVWMQASPEPI